MSTNPSPYDPETPEEKEIWKSRRASFIIVGIIAPLTLLVIANLTLRGLTVPGYVGWWLSLIAVIWSMIGVYSLLVASRAHSRKIDRRAMADLAAITERINRNLKP